MKYILPLLLASCTTTLDEAGRYLAPNYFETSYGQGEGDIDLDGGGKSYDQDNSAWTFTLGWYLQPISITTARRSGEFESIQAINPDAARIVQGLERVTESLRQTSAAMQEITKESGETQEEIIEAQKEIQNLEKKTLVDNLGKREATWTGGILSSLLGLWVLLRRFGILNGKHKEEE